MTAQQSYNLGSLFGVVVQSTRGHRQLPASFQWPGSAITLTLSVTQPCIRYIWISNHIFMDHRQCAQFVSLCSLQNALLHLARVSIRVRDQVRFMVGIRVSFRSEICKLCVHDFEILQLHKLHAAVTSFIFYCWSFFLYAVLLVLLLALPLPFIYEHYTKCCGITSSLSFNLLQCY